MALRARCDLRCGVRRTMDAAEHRIAVKWEIFEDSSRDVGTSSHP